jgi:hypothetical protein
MLRTIFISSLLLASSLSYARCELEFNDLSSKQARLSGKKTARNVSAVVGIFCYPVWIFTGYEAIKV